MVEAHPFLLVRVDGKPVREGKRGSDGGIGVGHSEAECILDVRAVHRQSIQLVVERADVAVRLRYAGGDSDTDGLTDGVIEVVASTVIAINALRHLVERHCRAIAVRGGHGGLLHIEHSTLVDSDVSPCRTSPIAALRVATGCFRRTTAILAADANGIVIFIILDGEGGIVSFCHADDGARYTAIVNAIADTAGTRYAVAAKCAFLDIAGDAAHGRGIERSSELAVLQHHILHGTAIHETEKSHIAIVNVICRLNVIAGEVAYSASVAVVDTSEGETFVAAEANWDEVSDTTHVNRLGIHLLQVFTFEFIAAYVTTLRQHVQVGCSFDLPRIIYGAAAAEGDGDLETSANSW